MMDMQKDLKKDLQKWGGENMEREVERICLLLSKLLDENRLDDLLRIIEDDEYMEQLMREFNILWKKYFHKILVHSPINFLIQIK